MYSGFKLHLVTNDIGEIIDFIFTPANDSWQISFLTKKVSWQVIWKKSNGLYGQIYSKKKVIIETVKDVLESTCQLDLLIIS